MPKKVDANELLRELKKANDDELRPVSTRVPVRCLRTLLGRCARKKVDLSVVLRQLIEENAASEKRDSVTLPPDTQQWLDTAVARVRHAYREGQSPIDAFLTEPLWKGSVSSTEVYDGPLAELITAAIHRVPVQEILDHRTLALVEEQRRRRRESYAQHLWREAVERAPDHVRPHAEKLRELERGFRGRLKLGWQPGPEDEDSGPPPLFWWFHDSVMNELAKGQNDNQSIQSLQLLIQGGYLIPDPKQQPNTFKWDAD